MKCELKGVGLMVVALVLSSAALGRVWTSADGRTVEAELKDYDPASGRVLLVRRGRKFVLKRDDLSEADQAYLVEFEKQREEEKEKAAAAERERIAAEKERAEAETRKAGTVVKRVTAGDHALAYYSYYPQNYTYGQKLPLLILFSPGGHGRGIINNFKQAADAHGWIVVGCDGLKNRMDEELGRERFREMLPDIEKNLPCDPEEMYMGGFSGGAQRAYHYSAEFDRPWKGVVACGGWLGGSDYSGLKYRRKMAVAIVNGDSDNNANNWVDRDSDVLGGRSCKVKLFDFKGGHVVGPPDVLSEAIGWIIKNRKKS